MAKIERPKVITVRVVDLEENPCVRNESSRRSPEWLAWRGKPIQVILAPISRKQWEKRWGKARCDTDFFWPTTDNIAEKVRGDKYHKYVCRHQIEIGD